jgi:hypothetical protein
MGKPVISRLIFEMQFRRAKHLAAISIVCQCTTIRQPHAALAKGDMIDCTAAVSMI